MKQKTMISSLSNAQLKNLTLLQKKAKEREEQGIFVVEGSKMFEEARDAGILVKAYASESFYQTKLAENESYLEGIEYEIVTDSVFKEVSDTKTPQGIMGKDCETFSGRYA
jgi:TrmH family RNA methyltransferase